MSLGSFRLVGKDEPTGLAGAKKCILFNSLFNCSKGIIVPQSYCGQKTLRDSNWVWPEPNQERHQGQGLKTQMQVEVCEGRRQQADLGGSGLRGGRCEGSACRCWPGTGIEALVRASQTPDPEQRLPSALSSQSTSGSMAPRGRRGDMKGRCSSPRDEEAGTQEGQASTCVLEPLLLVQHDGARPLRLR